MARKMTYDTLRAKRFPHPRGDGPLHDDTVNELIKISPPAWGWPGDIEQAESGQTDFPTRVGMARFIRYLKQTVAGFPHPRGDGPWIRDRIHIIAEISPPAWGWPGAITKHAAEARDFPTRVGMARGKNGWRLDAHRFPHPRGDGPITRRAIARATWISPPAWGWPEAGLAPIRVTLDFPTRVGMARVRLM